MTDQMKILRSALGTLEYIGKGGTAVVYGLPDLAPEALGVLAPQGLAYKEYTSRTLERAGPGLALGLRAMVALRDKLDPAQRELWDQRVIWPVRLVVDEADRATGVVMPLIPERFFQRVTPRSGGVRSVPREAEKLFGDVETMRRIGIPPVTQDVRIRLVGRIAATYALMHNAGVVIGDISGRNLVYNPDADLPAALVYDADSARLEGTRSPFGSQPHTPRWEPPEALAAARLYRKSRGSIHPETITAQSKATDVYKFGLLAVRILDYGKGKSVNRDPTAAIRVLHRGRQEHAARLLEASMSERPADRPTLREWYEAFNSGRPQATVARAARVSSQVPLEPPAEEAKLVDGQVVGDWVFHVNDGWHRRARNG